jgi:hypothetical protein
MNELVSHTQWRGLFNREGTAGVINALDALQIVQQDELVAAMQFAFEEKQEEIASHIDKRWRGFFSMEKLNNGAAWVNREILLFLRGEKSEFWLDLLFSNNGHAQKHPFSIAFQEVENTLRAGPDFSISRVERFFSLAVSHGIRTEDKSDSDYPSALHAALNVVPLLHRQPEEEKERWRSLLIQIESNNQRLAVFSACEDALLKAISSADIEAIEKQASIFARIPEKDRRISPFSSALRHAQTNDDYPLVACFEALASSGLSLRDRQVCGATPLFELLCSTELDASRLHAAAAFLLSNGADIDVRQSNSVFNASSDMTHCLHMAVYLEHAPWDILAPSVSSWNPLDVQGLTPLLYASREVRHRAVNELLDKGADPLARTPALNTALHEMFDYSVMDFLDIKCEQDEVAKVATRLKSLGLDPLALNDQGHDALTHACKSVCNDERAQKCMWLIRELHQAGWPMQSEAMLEALPAGYVNEDIGQFLLSNVQQKVLDQQTPHSAPRASRRPGL